MRVGGEQEFGGQVLMAACGDWHTLAVTKASTLWSWSLGRDGKLSHNDANNRLVPTQVEAQRFGDAKIVSATARETYPAAITKYGTLYTWGKGTCEMWDTEGVVAEVLWGLGHGECWCPPPSTRRAPRQPSPCRRSGCNSRRR